MTTVVVTGARGYIGSALTDRLAAAGYALRLISRSSHPGQTQTAGVAGREYVKADLRMDASWSGVMADAEAVVHLSSRTDLRSAEADPSGDDDINVEPVRAMIRAAERSGSRPKVIFASTVTIVGDRHANPVDEQTPDRPCSVYDRHKLACETLLRDATRRDLLRACSLRLSNVYGFGGASINSNRGVLNAMLKRAVNGEALTLFGHGSYVRDFTHLQDVVEAFQAAIASDRVCDGGHYVIASGRGITLADAFALIAAEARSVFGRAPEIRRMPEPADLHRIERRNFIGNSRLFEERTGWRPRIELQAGIQNYFRRAVAEQTVTVG